MRASAVLILGFLIAGCMRDFGAGGTGEMAVPKTELRQIKSTQMELLSTTRPTTSAAITTRPAPAPTVELTIERCRQLALQNNLDLRVDLLNPTIAKTFVTEEQARFESAFTTDLQYAKLDQPVASQLSGSQVSDLRVTPGIRVPLITGGQLQFDLPIERFGTNNRFATLNPAYTSKFDASISQPLLRGFGFDASAHGIRIAFYQYQQAEARTKLEVIRVLAAADRVYWRLYAARRELEVRKQEYDLAVAQLDRARRQVRAGAAADVEIIRAESGVADRVEAIILAENQVRDRQRDLKRMLNTPDLPMDGPTIVIPGSQPVRLFYKVNPRQLVRIAMKQRMELLDTELQIAAETAHVRFARNEMLPLVSLQYQYRVNGLGGNWDESFGRLGQHNFEDHTIGVQVEVPIGNEAARSRLRRALANRLQQLQTKEQRQAQIEQEILAAVDTLEADWQRTLAAQKRVLLNGRLLEAEIRQFNLQLRTSTDVLLAQANLANAQSSEIGALTDYQIAQVDIAFATGTVLGATHVIWEPAKMPK